MQNIDQGNESVSKIVTIYYVFFIISNITKVHYVNILLVHCANIVRICDLPQTTIITQQQEITFID